MGGHRGQGRPAVAASDGRLPVERVQFFRDPSKTQYQVLQDLSELELVKMNAFCSEQIEKSATEETKAAINVEQKNVEPTNKEQGMRK